MCVSVVRTASFLGFQEQATYCLEFTVLLYFPCVMIKSGAWFGKSGVFSAGDLLDLLDLKLTPPVLLIALIKAAFISSARVAAG